MAPSQELDDNINIIAALLHDVSLMHGVVFNKRALRLTVQTVRRRTRSEGLSFITKTMPRLGKALDKALTCTQRLNSSGLRFKPQSGSDLPRFLGEFFNRVLDRNGYVLQDPCPESIRVLRFITQVYYKYEEPYTEEQEQRVLAKFERTEQELSDVTSTLNQVECDVNCILPTSRRNPERYLQKGDFRKHAGTITHRIPEHTFESLARSVVLPLIQQNSAIRETGEVRPRSGGTSVEELTGKSKPGTPISTSDSSQYTESASDIRDPKGTRLTSGRQCRVVREAKILLQRLFSNFDPYDIDPRHGPGAVATKQKLWAKYSWTNVSQNITEVYPLDAYYYASLGHICDRFDRFKSVECRDLPARVILVPKDSRGPRLISCEPVDYQWIQQGLGRAIVRWTEDHWLTKHNVFFTDQLPNRLGALIGSASGRYATLDLNEASDRVTVSLVRLLFPSHIFRCLMACRSSSTQLPNGKVLKLQKFAPMGSALCFPVLALCVWSLLTAAASDTSTQEGTLVYGDDVIVPTEFTGDAINVLESFGLKVNHDKSCTAGFFRESCGMDAYKGYNVTPVRIKTVWTSTPSSDCYESWIAYANSFYRLQCFNTYELIVARLLKIYGEIPDEGLHLAVPSLIETPENGRPKRSRTHRDFQKKKWYVWSPKASKVRHVSDGWELLLRWFAEVANSRNRDRRAEIAAGREVPNLLRDPNWADFRPEEELRVCSYTQRGASMLVKRWR